MQRFDIKTDIMKPEVVYTILILCVLITLFQCYQLINAFRHPSPKVSLSPQVASYLKDRKDVVIKAQYFGVSPNRTFGHHAIMPSKINAEVVGILYAKPAQYAQVILKIGGQDEKILSLGDEIQPGIKIVKIKKRTVIVDHDGKLETLSLPKAQLIIEPLPSPLIEEPLK